MKISVCMATYNGEKYIKEQLTSILKQLSEEDEVIVSDDSSSDTTVEVVKNFNDKRIILFESQMFRSPIFNFENAIKKATGDIIVLADQDDIWMDNKVETIVESMKAEEGVSLKMFNGICINDDGFEMEKTLFEHIQAKEGLGNNILKNSFIGCNLVFTKKLCSYILPFPKDIPMHDMWLGSCAYLFGKVEFIDKKIFMYRLHENNFTGRTTSLFEKIKWRYQLIKNLLFRYINVKNTN